MKIKRDKGGKAAQVPPGFERVRLVLPAFQAFQVKQWEADAMKGRARK